MESLRTGRPCRSSLTRRDLLRVGGLSLAGLTLADILRSRAHAAGGAATNPNRGKSVIMIWMRGGPSHIDSFDMKPDAPAEIRGEFRPIATNVPGIQICEHLPLLSGVMDKLAIVRGIKSNDLGDHTPHYIITGSPDRGKRPAFGGIVSYLRPRRDGLPPYVSLMYDPPGLYDNEGPMYLGRGTSAVRAPGRGIGKLEPAPRGLARPPARSPARCSASSTRCAREARRHEAMSGTDAFTRQALADDHVAQGPRRVRHRTRVSGDASPLRQVLREFSDRPAAGRSGRLGRHAQGWRLGHAREEFHRHARLNCPSSIAASTRW